MKLLVLIGLFIVFANSCEKDKDGNNDDDGSNTENTFTDSRDGTVYETVTIGDQVWMAENLKYLPSVVGMETESETIPYYYIYNYNGSSVTDAQALSNYATYGVLYNWTAAMASYASSDYNPSGVQGVCPPGWHLPSDDEWAQLTHFLGDNAGGKLKSTGNLQEGSGYWQIPNTGATNESGFTALPGGFHRFESYIQIGEACYWWSATKGDVYGAYSHYLHHDDSEVHRNSINKNSGMSVRCVKD